MEEVEKKLQPPPKEHHLPAVGSGVDHTWASLSPQEPFTLFTAHSNSVEHCMKLTGGEPKVKPLAFLDCVQDTEEDARVREAHPQSQTPGFCLTLPPAALEECLQNPEAGG